MKIQYASDLHLEFGANSQYLRKHPLDVVGDILLLAGDSGYLGVSQFNNHPFWDWASEHYTKVIAILGNHELYAGFDINGLSESLELKLRDNVSLYYNNTIQLTDRIDLIISTLWSYINPLDAFATERSVNDFHYISNGDERLTAERFNEEYFRCLNYIKKSVAKSSAEHIIVMTHHVPSFRLMSEEFIGSRINGAFTSELGNYIADSRIAYWIYGHSHRNIDGMIGNTKCLSNQLGYVSSGEHLTFRHNAIIDIP